MPEDNRSGANRMEESEMAMVKKNVKRATGGHLQKPRPFGGAVFMLLFPLLLAFKELLNLWSECLSFWPSLGA